MTKPKIISFFAGIGGIDLGFRQAGFDVAVAYEIDKFAIQTYLHNVGGDIVKADVTKLTWQDLPKADVWTFGFPCQDLSIAGHRRGMKMFCEQCQKEMEYEDYVQNRNCAFCHSEQIRPSTRSGLFFEIMRLLDECKLHAPEKVPKILLAENVKPLKKYLPQLKEEYQFRGFTMYAELFNSKYWNVPQNRERYYVVGIHESIQKKFTFPKQQTDFVPKLSSILEPVVDEKYYISDEKASKIISQALKRLPKLENIHACLTPERIEKRQTGRRAKENEEPSFTITTQDRHGVIQKEIVGVLVSPKTNIHKTEQSYTLDTSYYKGLGYSQKQSGVLEFITDARCLTERRTEEAKRIRREYRQKYGKDFSPRRAKEVVPRQDEVANCLTATQTIEHTLIETIQDFKTLEVIPFETLPKEIQHWIQQALQQNQEITERSIHIVGKLEDKGYDMTRRVYDPEGIAPTLTTMQGGNTQPKVLVTESDKKTKSRKPIFVGGIDSNKWLENGGEQSRNYKQGYRVYSAEGIATSLTARGGGLGGPTGLYLVPVQTRYRVRKLTPLECGRLQGFPMDQWEQVVSDSQAYKQFGNSVTVPLVKAIAEQIKKLL